MKSSWTRVLAVLPLLVEGCQGKLLSLGDVISPKAGDVWDSDIPQTVKWVVDPANTTLVVENIILYTGNGVGPPPAYYKVYSCYNYATDPPTFDKEVLAGLGAYTFNISEAFLPQSILPISKIGIQLTERCPLNVTEIYYQNHYSLESDFYRLYSASKAKDTLPQAGLFKLTYSAVLGSSSRKAFSQKSETVQLVFSIVSPILLLVAIGFIPVLVKKHHLHPLSVDLQAPQSEQMETPRKSPLPSRCRAIGSKQAAWSIGLAGFMSTVPVFTLSISLIVVLEVSRIYQSSSHIGTGTLLDEDAYYLHYSATRYTTIASWASSIAMLVPGFIATLVWYFFVPELAKQHSNLPTPFQINLLVALRSGSILSVWEFLAYSCSRMRERMSTLLGRIGMIILLVTSLGGVIWAADTLLHIMTSTVAVDMVTPSTVSNYSYSVPAACKSYSAIAFDVDDEPKAYYRATCAMDAGPRHFDAGGYPFGPVDNSTATPRQTFYGVRNATESVAILRGQSLDTKIQVLEQDGQRISFVAPVDTSQDADYIASTLAARSTCGFAESSCVFDVAEKEDPQQEYLNFDNFTCGAFSSSDTSVPQVGQLNVITGLSSTSKWTDHISWSKSLNPTNQIIWIAGGNSRLVGRGVQDHILRGQESLFGDRSNGSLIMSCQTEFLYLNYSFVRGSLQSYNLSRIEDLNIVGSIMQPYWDLDDLPFMRVAAYDIYYSASEQGALKVLGDAINLNYLAPIAPLLNKTANIAEQTRRNILVARVPKGPLWLLLASLLLSALMGIAATIAALRRPLGEAHNLQSMLSIPRLTATLFESSGRADVLVETLWETYAEASGTEKSGRVCFVKAEDGNGWRFIIIEEGKEADDNTGDELLTAAVSTEILEVEPEINAVTVDANEERAAAVGEDSNERSPLTTPGGGYSAAE